MNAGQMHRLRQLSGKMQIQRLETGRTVMTARQIDRNCMKRFQTGKLYCDKCFLSFLTPNSRYGINRKQLY